MAKLICNGCGEKQFLLIRERESNYEEIIIKCDNCGEKLNTISGDGFGSNGCVDVIEGIIFEV